MLETSKDTQWSVCVCVLGGGGGGGGVLFRHSMLGIAMCTHKQCLEELIIGRTMAMQTSGDMWKLQREWGASLGKVHTYIMHACM